MEKLEMIKNVIKEFKEEKIEVVSIFDTTYEDGTKWVEYRVNGLVGYELTDDYYNEEDKKELENIINNDKELLKTYREKIFIDSIEDILKNIINEVAQSDNEMWFIEDGDMTEKEKEKFFNAVEENQLGEYVEDEGDYITVYGGIITKVFF